MVSAATTSVTKITGFAQELRGSSLATATRAACARCAVEQYDAIGGVSVAAWRSRSMDCSLRSSGRRASRDCFGDRPERQRREEGQPAEDQDHPDQQRHEQRPVGREGAGGRGHVVLPARRAGDGQHRHDERIAAEQHGDARAWCSGRACWRRSRRRPSRCCRWPRCRHRGSRRAHAARGPGPRRAGHRQQGGRAPRTEGSPTGMDEQRQDRELDLPRLDLLAEVLGRAADHQSGQEHGEHDEEQHAVETRRRRRRRSPRRAGC